MPNVKIKRLRTNFQIRFGYDETLIKYIKTLPVDQIKTSFETVIGETGQIKKDWFHMCNFHGLVKMLWFFQENHIQYNYENLNENQIFRIESYTKEKKEKIELALNFKRKEYDSSNDNYSFMKIQPYPYQKKAVKFFELVDGICLLGDEPGVGKTLSAIAYSVKHQLKTIVVCPASMAIPWAKEILKFTNERPYVFKYKIKKKENLNLGTIEESKIHIVSYNSLETYLKFEVHHKCQNTHCDFEETSYIKKHKKCPKCFKDNSVKSKNSDLCSFYDKKGVELKTQDYDLIVLDEAHYCKNPKTTRTKLVNAGFKKTKKK